MAGDYLGDRPSAGAVTLYCLPFAGGGISAYHGWERALAPAVDVRPLLLPGRDGRADEPATVDVAAISAAIARHSTGPYAIYGHSMGALVAFEVVRRLSADGVPPPTRLFAGAARAPHLSYGLADARMSDDEILTAFVTAGGTPAAVRDVPELRERYLPVFRADVEWLADYRCAAGAPLDVPVTVITGRDDDACPLADVLGWRLHTSHGLQVRTVPGGHFFHTEEPSRTLHLLRGALSGSR